MKPRRRYFTYQTCLFHICLFFSGLGTNPMHALVVERCPRATIFNVAVSSNILQLSWHTRFWNNTDQLFWKMAFGFVSLLSVCLSVCFFLSDLINFIHLKNGQPCCVLSVPCCEAMVVLSVLLLMLMLVKAMPLVCLYYKITFSIF